jgi:hypothetical protein
MINITVLEGAETAVYEFEGETWNVELDAKKLGYIFLEARQGIHNVEFEDDTEIVILSVEEYDGEYDITENIYTVRSMKDYDFSDKHVKTYKRKNSALDYVMKAQYVYTLDI